MHYIKHGPAPDFLRGDPNAFEKAGLEWRDLYDIENTRCEQNGIGPEQVDTLKHELAKTFGGGARSRRRGVLKWEKYPICAYCEVRTDGGTTSPQIDHFRPRSRYKHLTFKWDNLMYACRRCNKKKCDKFPEDIGGYVSPADPCCAGYFDYDIKTGEIKAKSDIKDQALKVRIEQTICDLDLNSDTLCRDRKGIHNRIDEKNRKQPLIGHKKRLGEFTKQSSPFSSYAKACAAQVRD